MSFAMALVAAMAFSMADAQAQKRMGGGNSVGKQQSGVSQSTPAGQQAAQRQSTPPSAAPQAQPQRNKWLGPLAGLAAGIGLAALASHLGFGEELASFMLIALLAVVALVVVRMIMARRAGAQAGPQPAMAGAGASNVPQGAPNNSYYAPHDVAASGSAQGFGAASAMGSGLSIPAGFDVTGFERNAKVQFVRLQASFDAANLNDLREFTSPEMFAELKMQIDERQGASNRTEVVTLEAQLLGIESNSVEHVASVMFRGSLREGDVVMAKAFEEVWNLTKPAQGDSGWVLAGIQQTQ
jgi:predicted lipid-binding transport protein (Tim44 family)